MTAIYDPRKVLRQVSNALLREFFRRRKELWDVPWGRLRETQIEPIFAGWQALPELKRQQVQVVFQDIHELATRRGPSVLAEEIRARCPDQVGRFTACRNRYDQVMWTHLWLPEVFAEASLFVRADTLSRGRSWVTRNTLPQRPLEVTEDAKAALKAALADFYWQTQLRGSCVEIEYHRRGNGAEHFYVYLDDYPDSRLVFNNSGQLEQRTDRLAFDNLFVFDPHAGTLSLYAPGGKKVQLPLQQAFCRSLLNLELGPPDPTKPVFHLDHLLDPDFRLSPVAGVTAARILALTIELRDMPGRRITLEADPDRGPHDIHEMVQSCLNLQNFPLDRWLVTEAKFHLSCWIAASRRNRPITFTVWQPSSSDLKSKLDEMQAIGQQCLTQWEIRRD